MEAAVRKTAAVEPTAIPATAPFDISKPPVGVLVGTGVVGASVTQGLHKFVEQVSTTVISFALRFII
jgi:hypothetical protein